MNTGWARASIVHSGHPRRGPQSRRIAPTYQVQQVVDGSLDIAAVWGPFAGYYKADEKCADRDSAGNLMEDQIPLEFETRLWRADYRPHSQYKIDLALEDNKAAIEKVLATTACRSCKCSDCIVEGDLPAHGVYAALPPTPASELKSSVTMKQTPVLARSRRRCERGVQQRRHGGLCRSRQLPAEQGRRSQQARRPGGDAAEQRRSSAQPRPPETASSTMAAEVNARDANGMTALLEAINLYDVPTIKVLASHRR